LYLNIFSFVKIISVKHVAGRCDGINHNFVNRKTSLYEKENDEEKDGQEEAHEKRQEEASREKEKEKKVVLMKSPVTTGLFIRLQ